MVKTATAELSRLGPGLAATALIAAVAMAISAAVAIPLSPVLLAVLMGLLVANAAPLADRLHSVGPGAAFSAKRILRVGIILLGAQLSLADVAEVGGSAALLVVACMTLAVVAVVVAGAALGVGGSTRLLIAVGTAVCGNTAIMATAPIIGADEREVSYSVGTITLLGTLGLLLFPILGRYLELSDAVFGLWAGLAINDTSQVVAAGAAYSDGARDVATVVKLLRNTLMAPILVVIAVVVARRSSAAGQGGVLSGVRKSFPLFIFGFLGLAAARSFGLLPTVLIDASGFAASLCIVIAIAGVGLGTRFASVRAVGPRPLVVGAIAALGLAVVALLLAMAGSPS